MKLAPLALALLLAAGGPAEDAADGDRFRGTPAEALAAIRRTGDDEPERALAIARGLAEDASLPEPLRAEMRYAEGLVLARAGRRDEALGPFASARALAGPGELRADATYNQGTVELERAEARRAETLRGLADPAAGAAPGGAGAADPLAALRRAYLRARAVLEQGLIDACERGLDPPADLRANLELIQRRLREIDALEEAEQRREEQERPKVEGEPKEEEGGEGEPQEGAPEEEKEGEGGEPRESRDGAQQREGQGQGEGERQGGPDGPPGPDPPPPAPEGPEELPEARPSAPAESQPAERLLSREEVMRILERLDELEEERVALEQALRAIRRVPVEKDW